MAVGVMLLWHESCCSALGLLQMISLDCSHRYTFCSFLYLSLRAPSDIGYIQHERNFHWETLLLWSSLVSLKCKYYLSLGDIFWQLDSHDSYTKAMFEFFLINFNVTLRNQWLPAGNPNLLILNVWKNSAKQNINVICQ